MGIGETARQAGLSVWTDLLRIETLLTLGQDGRAVGRLAESWAWEDEGRTLRLKLKEGVRLHDGSLLKTELVLALLQKRALAPITERRFGFAYVTRVTSPDPTTILIRLSQPDVFLLTELLDLYVARADAPDVATGAFRIVTPGPQVELQRFPDYHGGVSPLAGVKIITYDTHRSAWAALMRGEVDAVQEVSRESIEFMERSSRVRTYSMLQPGYVAVVFNQRHTVLRHVEVRRALVEALDRQAVLQRAMRGHGQVADGPIWPFHWAYVPSRARIGYDHDGAKARLDRAGFRLPPATREGELRKRFSFRCLVYDEDPLYERMALMIQRQLFDIGVEMVIELVGMDEFGPRARSGDFDAFLFPANAGRALDFTYRFWHSGMPPRLRMQNSGYAGANAGLDRLRRSISDEDTRAAVADLTRTFHEDAPAAFIAWLEITRAVDARFDVGGQQAQDPFASIWQWRLAPGPQR